MKKKVFVLLTLSFSKDKKSGQWIGICEELGTSTFGDTIEEVSEELNDLVVLHLATLEKVGERERFFKENHINMYYEFPPYEIELKTSLKKDVFVKPFAHQLVYN